MIMFFVHCSLMVFAKVNTKTVANLNGNNYNLIKWLSLFFDISPRNCSICCNSLFFFISKQHGAQLNQML